MRGKPRAFRLLNLVAYFLSGFVPRRRDLFVFGAWHGRRYADNSKYLFEHLNSHLAPVELVWCGEEYLRSELPTDGNVGFVAHGSLRGTWTVARAGTCFVSHGFGDVASVNVLRGCRRVYLGHGIAIKNMGAEPSPPTSPIGELLHAIRRRPWAHELWSASSQIHAEKLLAENQHAAITPDQILMTGQPRLDLLVSVERNLACRMSIRERLRERHGVPLDAPLVLYMPTFRDSGTAAFSFGTSAGRDARPVVDVLRRRGAWLAERSHFADTAPRLGIDGADRIVDLNVEAGVDAQQLLAASDVLITDYSGCYIDFLLLDRPVLHFAYDYAQYRDADRGLYFDLDDVRGGPIVSDVEQLARALDEALEHPGRDAERRRCVRQLLLSYEHGEACERTAAVVLADLPPHRRTVGVLRRR